jgi:hypothetical protein
MSDDNGWAEYKMSVMHQLEFLTAEVHGTRVDLNEHDKNNIKTLGEVKTEIALLKQKAGAWGAVAGVLGAVVVTVVAQLIIHILTR